ncbi:signal peptidase I [candidate division KSB3 bacterium]|uniref:Signal peptidase I n=1 Tax=candidate division KSB3 bacterium TaxID=2044937 RepID=A0A2G6EFA7_9BACT|nr:MAG: signal peptidase I [candidate division KSB3 bacterium]PIE28382.1 MAG: signal peptidase I [candidate division KSB3 bacterium]
MNFSEPVYRFFFPKLTPVFCIRLVLVALGAYLFFSHIIVPVRLQGASMEPSYHDGSRHFFWRPAFWWSEPQRGDVVLVRLAGSRVMLLKRIVATSGETVEFRNGRLFVDGALQEEPYVRLPCSWNLPVRTVAAGHVYVIGDNRSMPIEQHDFGQTSHKRLGGRLLW